MRWFIPSWNGDFRVEDDPNHTDASLLRILDPTPGELGALVVLGKYFKRRGWSDSDELWDPKGKKQQTVRLGAPISKVSVAMAKQLKTGKQTLSAVQYKDGRVETVEGTGADLDRFSEQVEKQKDKADSAVTVKRPTPCCPQCHAGAIEPATEVLLSFLDEDQHQQWAERRSLICHGGRTGYPYLIAHRHSAAAKRMGRICADLRTRTVLHFHDMSVPPEEEVLAAMLCLQHREHWLRNEATMLSTIPMSDGSYGYASLTNDRFKNPFGDGSDGVPDAGLTGAIGVFCLALTGNAERALG